MDRVQSLKDRLKGIIKNNKVQFLWALVSTFIFGLIAHAYGVFNYTLGFDGLSHFYYGEFFEGINLLKIQTGRWFVPVYKAIFNINITVPWIQFVIACVWVSISVVLIIKIFGLQSKISYIIISAFMVTNIAVAAQTATFLYELDANMFAMMLSVASVYLWTKFSKLISYLISVLLLMISLGIYQSYISVSITLVLICSISLLLNNVKVSKVIINGIKYIGVLVVSVVLYFVMIFVMTRIYQTEYVSNYNTIDTGIFSVSSIFQCRRAFLNCLQKIFRPITFLSETVLFVSTLFIALLAIICVLFYVKYKKVRFINILTSFFLVLIMPLGMNVTFVLMGGWVHSLMEYAFSLFWIFLIILFEKMRIDNKAIHMMSVLAYCLMLLLIGNNIFVANGYYVEKGLQEKATLAQMTNVIYDMRNYDGYDSNKDELIIVGQSLTYNEIQPFNKLKDVFGFCRTIEWNTNTDAYFKYVLNYPVKVASIEKFLEVRLDNEIKEMPSYPNKGYIMKKDNYLIIKLSDYKLE